MNKYVTNSTERMNGYLDIFRYTDHRNRKVVVKYSEGYKPCSHTLSSKFRYA